MSEYFFDGLVDNMSSCCGAHVADITEGKFVKEKHMFFFTKEKWISDDKIIGYNCCECGSYYFLDTKENVE